MDPRIKVLTYDLNDIFKVYVLLKPGSRKFYLSYRLYSLEKLISFEESLFISPSITQYEFGENSSSSLYRDIVGNSTNGYEVTDVFGDISVYKKLPTSSGTTPYFYSFNNDEELHVDSLNYIFINKDLVRVKYDNSSHYPFEVSKTIEYSNFNVFNISETGTSTYYKTISDHSNNLLVGFKRHLNIKTTIELLKNDNVYESIIISYNNNHVVNSITRKRGTTTLESYSLSLTDSEYQITDNKTNNIIKITYSGEDISSITFGKNGELLEHSTITFTDSTNDLLIKKQTGQFTNLHKGDGYFDYSYNELGTFSKETIEQINSDRNDSFKLTKKISFNYNPTICEEQSYIQNAYFNNGLSNYVITGESLPTIRVVPNSAVNSKCIIGSNVLNVVLDGIAVISQEITNFPNGLPNVLSFWSKCSYVSVTLRLDYYLNNSLLSYEEHELQLGFKYVPYIYYLDCPTVTNKIVVSFTIAATRRSSFNLGALRLTRENNVTNYVYDNPNKGTLAKVKDECDEVCFEYSEDNYLTIIKNDYGRNFTIVYEGNTVRAVTDSYGGITQYLYDECGYPRRVTTVSSIPNDSRYTDSTYIYENDELSYYKDINDVEYEYDYSQSTPSLEMVSDSIIKTSYEENLPDKEFTTSFQGIGQTSIYSSNIETYNDNHLLYHLTTNNVQYIFSYQNNNLSRVSHQNTSSIFTRQSLVNYSYHTCEYLSSDLLISKTINNTTFEFRYTDEGKLYAISCDSEILYSFEYDAIGNITRIDDVEVGVAHRFQYDINGNLTFESHAETFTKTYSYDHNKLLYTRVYDSYEDRLHFSSNNIGRYLVNNSLLTRVSNYSYKNNYLDNYFPLKSSLCSENSSPSNVSKKPTFVYDDIKHHNVLSINETKIQYDAFSENGFYVFFEFKLNEYNSNANTLIFIKDKNSDRLFTLYFSLMSNLYIVDETYGTPLYETNIGRPSLGQWHNLGFSLKFENNSLTIRIVLDGVADRYVINNYSPISQLSFIVGGDLGEHNYIHGSVENLVYGNSYLSQTKYNLLKTAFSHNYQYKETSYDVFGRVISLESFESLNKVTTNYEYKSLGDKQTTFVKKESHYFKGYNDDNPTLISEYEYTYIKSKLACFSLDNENEIQYEYDELGRIYEFTKLHNGMVNFKINYSYDSFGNITSKTTNDNGQTTTINYTYDSDNPNLLLQYGNKGFNYSGIHPTSKYPLNQVGHQLFNLNYSFKGNRLISISKTTQTVSFKYGYNGLRGEKTVITRPLFPLNSPTETERIFYLYDNDKLILETHNNEYEIRYQYDSLGKLLYIEKYNSNNEQVWKFYYIVNIFNDVIGLVNESGEQVVSYLYDPFGNVLNVTDTSGVNLSTINPFRYKSYYYDEETSLYYLTTRYYDPEIGRFISPDSVDYLDPTELSGLNLFTYCNNDPVNYCDPSGHSAILIGLLIGAIIGIAVGVGYAAYTDYSDDNSINGSVGAETYLGYGLLGGVIGGAFGAGIGYIWPALSTFAASSFTIGGGISMSGGAVALSSGITITGAQILEGAGVLAGLGIMYMIPKHGTPNTKITDGGSFGEYDSNGNLSYRVDTTGRPHYIKSIGKYCLPHKHQFTWKLINGVWRFIEEVLPYIL